LFDPQTISVYHCRHGPSTRQTTHVARSRSLALLAGLRAAPRPVGGVRRFRNTFAKAGEALTPGEFGLLVLVDRNAGLSQMALARALAIDRSTLVPILDRLQARGLLMRHRSPTDGRTHALALTPVGEKALARFARLVRTHEKRIASNLSAAETRTLIELLEKVRGAAGSL
jgi:DNA-binding MarR family transcriptional regulator